MLEEKKITIFPEAHMLHDGSFTTPQGNVVQTNYVDLSGALPLDGLSLAKASEPPFDLRTAAAIRLSAPKRIPQHGGSACQGRTGGSGADLEAGNGGRRGRGAGGAGQAHASPWCESRARTHQDDVQGDGAEDADKRRSVALTFGNDCLIYCILDLCLNPSAPKPPHGPGGHCAMEPRGSRSRDGLRPLAGDGCGVAQWCRTRAGVGVVRVSVHRGPRGRIRADSLFTSK